MAIIIFCSAILNLLLGFLVNKKSKTKIQQKFSYVAFFICFWLLVNVVYFTFPKYPFINLSYAVGMLVIYAIFDWSLLFLKSKIGLVPRLLAGIFAVFVSVLVMIPNLIINTDKLVQINYGFESEKSGLYILFALTGTIFFLLSMLFLISSFRSSQGLDRLRKTYLLLGFGLPILMVIIVDFVLPFIIQTWVDSLDALASILFVAIIGYAITRHQLLDIKLIIRKGTIQVATFGILFVVYAYLLLLVQRSSSNAINLSNETTLLFVILIIAVAIEPMRRLIYKWIDNLFESKEREREESLKRLQLLSASNVQFETLKISTSQELSKNLETKVEFILTDKKENILIGLSSSSGVMGILEQGKVIIKDEIQFRHDSAELGLKNLLDLLQKENISALIPIGSGDQFLGAFIIKSTEKTPVFTADKIEFMKNFARQVEFAFASSLAYKYAIERIKI